MAAPGRGEVWLVDLGLAAEVRPALVPYKLYAESFLVEEHLRRIQEEARAIVAAALSC